MKLYPQLGNIILASNSYYDSFLEGMETHLGNIKKADIDKFLLSRTRYTHGFEDELADDFEDCNSCPDTSQRDRIDPFNVYYRERLIVTDDLAIVHIKDFLSANSSFLERWYDYGTSYESTRWIIEEITDLPNIKQVLFVIDSGGGELHGLSTVTSMIAELGMTMEKGTYAFTSTVAASAAYAIMASCNVTACDPWATVGSIGVAQILQTTFRWNKEKGIDAYIARSGDNKMIPNNIEPLTKKVKSTMDNEVRQYASLFFDMIIAARPSIKGNWKSGGVYIGSKALSNNLVDTITDHNTLQQRLLDS